MEKRVPVVAAQSVISGRSYESCLKEYNAMTPQQQAAADDSYVENNMGYGEKAWKAYTDAKQGK